MSAPPIAAKLRVSQAQLVACNLRRLMAKYGITYDEVVAACGLDERTVRGIARGEKKPHARTLHRLADGLGVAVDELFVDAATVVAARFDEATNPVVGQVLESHAELFEGWSVQDFAELYSRVGHGGQLTASGAVEIAEQMNRKRQVLAKARVVLESRDGALLADFVELLFERVRVER